MRITLERGRAQLQWSGLLLALIIAGLLVPVGPVYADLDDIETEMEDAFAESEAARQEAAASARRRKEEDKRRQEAAEDAKAAIAKAKAKARDASQEIAAAEKAAERSRQERLRHEKDKAAADEQYNRYVKQIEEARRNLEKIREETKVAQQLKDERKQEVANLVQQLREVEDAIQKAKDQQGQVVRELEDAKQDEKKVAERLRQTQAALSREEAATKAKLAKFRAEIDRVKNLSAKHEAEMRELRKGVETLEEQVVIAEAEAEQAKQRLSESSTRVEAVRRETAAQRQELAARRQVANRAAKGLEGQEAMARMDEAGAEQANTQVSAALGAGDVNVALHDKPQRLKLSRDCNVRSAPTTRGSKVIVMQRKNSHLPVTPHDDTWMKVYRRQAYIARSCF